MDSMSKTARDILEDGDVPVLRATGHGGEALLYIPRVPCDMTEPANLVTRLLDEETVEWVCYADGWMCMWTYVGEPRLATLSEALAFEGVSSASGGIYARAMSKMSEDYAVWSTVSKELSKSLREAQESVEVLETQVEDLTGAKESAIRRLTSVQSKVGNLEAALIEWADDNAVDFSFDEVLGAHGFEGRKREFEVSLDTTLNLEERVWATSPERAREIASARIQDWALEINGVVDADVSVVDVGLV